MRISNLGCISWLVGQPLQSAVVPEGSVPVADDAALSAGELLNHLELVHVGHVRRGELHCEIAGSAAPGRAHHYIFWLMPRMLQSKVTSASCSLPQTVCLPQARGGGCEQLALTGCLALGELTAGLVSCGNRVRWPTQNPSQACFSAPSFCLFWFLESYAARWSNGDLEAKQR